MGLTPYIYSSLSKKQLPVPILKKLQDNQRYAECYQKDNDGDDVTQSKILINISTVTTCQCYGTSGFRLDNETCTHRISW